MAKSPLCLAAALCLMPSLLYADAVGIAAGQYKAFGMVGSNMATARAQARKECKKRNNGVDCAWAVSSANSYLIVVECPVKNGDEFELVRWGSFSKKSVDAARKSAKKKLKTRVSGNGFTPKMDECTDVIFYDGNEIHNLRE